MADRHRLWLTLHSTRAGVSLEMSLEAVALNGRATLELGEGRVAYRRESGWQLGSDDPEFEKYRGVIFDSLVVVPL